MYLDALVSKMGQTDATIEPFIGIVVSDTNLDLNGFSEFTLLAFFEHVMDGLLEEVGVNFAH
jgi:hypothetical protein